VLDLTLTYGFLVSSCFLFLFLYLAYSCLKPSLYETNIFLKCNCIWVNGSLKSFL
jgi:hypothetical protein